MIMGCLFDRVRIMFFFIMACLALSYEPELPAGAAIIQIAGASYLLVILVKRLFRRFA